MTTIAMETCLQDRPFDSPFPSGKLMKAEDVTQQLKGRQAEVRGEMMRAPGLNCEHSLPTFLKFCLL
jgi:hypothetical protein